MSMPSHAVTRLASFTLVAVALTLGTGCGSATAPSPTLLTDTFTGTLQPLGSDFKTFSITYNQSSSDLSVSVDSLKTVANSTPVTGITIGIGFGAVSGQHLWTPDTDAYGGPGPGAVRAERRVGRELLRRRSSTAPPERPAARRC